MIFPLTILYLDVLEAFKRFDEAQEGHVDLLYLRNIVECMGDPFDDYEVDRMIELGDDDSDGTINYDEVMRLLQTHGRGIGVMKQF